MFALTVTYNGSKPLVHLIGRNHVCVSMFAKGFLLEDSDV